MLRGLVALAALALAVPAATAGTTTLVHFKSPSGNINCIGGTAPSAFVDCLVKNAAWPYKPPKPASCDLDWAPTDIALGHHKVSVGACRGDIGPLCGPSSGSTCTTLGYGQSVSIGPIRCTSATDGVTCAYTSAPKTGFKIARQGFSVFSS